MIHEIKRWTDGAVLWSGEAESLGEAARKAIAAGADLTGADLTGAVLRYADLTGAVLRDAVLRDADLTGADLTGADLTGADLTGAVLRYAVLRYAVLTGAVLRDAVLTGAVLTGAVLRDVRDDLYAVLALSPGEVPGLLTLLRDGRVNGSLYEGECACLVGSLANLRGVHFKSIPGLVPNNERAAERWFLAIREGDTPSTSPIAAITAEWIEAWLRERDAAVPVHVALTWRGDLARLRADLVAAGVDVAALAVTP